VGHLEPIPIGLDYPDASCLGNLTAPLAPRTWKALVPDDPGPFPLRLRALATLDPQMLSPSLGAGQVAFLGEAEPRAARPGVAPQRHASRPSVGSAVNKDSASLGAF
jgi:hypothetical protein